MTRGFDDITYKSLDTENKFFNPIWIWGQYNAKNASQTDRER